MTVGTYLNLSPSAWTLDYLSGPASLTHPLLLPHTTPTHSEKKVSSLHHSVEGEWGPLRLRLQEGRDFSEVTAQPNSRPEKPGSIPRPPAGSMGPECRWKVE